MGAEVSFFIGSARGSGAERVGALLNTHPAFCVDAERNLLRLSVMAALAADNGGRAAPRLAQSISNRQAALARSFVRLLVRHRTAATGKARYGDETPSSADDVPALAKLFPAARFIHVLRDGRDVAAARLTEQAAGRRWRSRATDGTVADLARRWADRVYRARGAAAALGFDRYLEVRHETLGEFPRETARQLVEFLAEPCTEDWLDHLQPAPPRANWSTLLCAEELREFDSVPEARRLLGELGYPPSPAAPARAASTAASTATATATSATSPSDPLEQAQRAERDGHADLATACWLRALRHGVAPARERACVALLGVPTRPESVRAAQVCRHDPRLAPALATWLTHRGLDSATAKALVGLGTGS